MNKKNLFTIYRFFNFLPIIILRFFSLIFLTILVIVSLSNLMLLKIIFAIYGLFLANEIFLLFKILEEKPKDKVGFSKDSMSCVVFKALSIYKSSKDAYDLAVNLQKSTGAKFIKEKIGNFELYKDDILKESLIEKAFEIARANSQDYIGEVDLFVAYLLLTEEKSRMLEGKDLREQDILNLVNWVEKIKNEKKRDLTHFQFDGSGIFDFFIFGWNYETRKYSSDFTSQVLSEKFVPSLIGREKEYKRLLIALSKEKNNNVLFVGDEGTGKTSIVKYFAYESHIGNAPKGLSHKKVYEFFADRIIAGVQNQGELEQRIISLFDDVHYSGNIIIFIQNIENIFGAGGLKLDITSAIYPYLNNGKLPIISTSNNSSYKTYLENRQDLNQSFEVIKIEEPDQNLALLMLFAKINEIEKKYNVSFTYNALKSAVEFSSSYLIDKYLPGKAIDLLESIAAETKIAERNIIDKPDVVRRIEEKVKVVISNPTENEKQVLLNLESEIHKRIIDQNEAVNVIASAIRRMRSGFSDKKRPITNLLFLGPTGVGKTETAKALASIYFGDERKMIRLDMSEYQTQDSIKRLLGSLPGEAYSPSQFIEQVKENPFSLILLDEFEKANPRILDVFLQVFDDGRLTDNSGRTIPFTNTIIIATSNAGTELIREKLAGVSDIEILKPEILDYLQKNQIFKPELLNRFDDIVLFKPLGKEEVKSIAKILLEQSIKMQEEKGIFLSYDEKLLEKIAKEGFNIEFGGRYVRRYIDDNIENFIANAVLSNQIKKGDRKTISVDENNQIII